MQRRYKLKEAFMLSYSKPPWVVYHFRKSPTILLPQHNTVSWSEVALLLFAVMFREPVYMCRHRMTSSCLPVWVCLNICHGSFQKLYVKISVYAFKRKKYAFLYPFLFSCWLQANIMAGAAAATLGQEMKDRVEDSRAIRQREPGPLTLYSCHTPTVLPV